VQVSSGEGLANRAMRRPRESDGEHRLGIEPRKYHPWVADAVLWAEGMKGFLVLPRRWVVEHTFSWFNRNQRLAKDFEKSRRNPTPVIGILCCSRSW
jgi:transposase